MREPTARAARHPGFASAASFADVEAFASRAGLPSSSKPREAGVSAAFRR